MQWSTMTLYAPTVEMRVLVPAALLAPGRRRPGGCGCAGSTTSWVAMSMPPRMKVMPGDGAVWPAMVRKGSAILSVLRPGRSRRRPRTPRCAAPWPRIAACEAGAVAGQRGDADDLRRHHRASPAPSHRTRKCRAGVRAAAGAAGIKCREGHLGISVPPLLAPFDRAWRFIQCPYDTGYSTKRPCATAITRRFRRWGNSGPIAPLPDMLFDALYGHRHLATGVTGARTA